MTYQALMEVIDSHCGVNIRSRGEQGSNMGNPDAFIKILEA
jgi:hypothetical protein